MRNAPAGTVALYLELVTAAGVTRTDIVYANAAEVRAVFDAVVTGGPFRGETFSYSNTPDLRLVGARVRRPE